jgi:hypothetical protein
MTERKRPRRPLVQGLRPLTDARKRAVERQGGHPARARERNPPDDGPALSTGGVCGADSGGTR